MASSSEKLKEHSQTIVEDYVSSSCSDRLFPLYHPSNQARIDIAERNMDEETHGRKYS